MYITYINTYNMNWGITGIYRGIIGVSVSV